MPDELLQLALDAADMGSWDLDLRSGYARHSLRHDQIFGHARLFGFAQARLQVGDIRAAEGRGIDI